MAFNLTMETQSKARTLWMKKLELRDDKTAKRYIQNVDRFLLVNNIDSLETLYQMKKAKVEDERDLNRVESLINEHFMWLQSDHPEFNHKALKSPTALQFIASIRHFFKSQNVELKIDTKEFEIDESLGRDSIQSSQLKAIWDSVATEFRLKNRAILAILKDSGIRVSDLAEIKISEYLEAKLITDEQGKRFKVFALKINEKKRKRMAIHIGEDAITAIEAYLETRPNFKPNEYLILNLNGEQISSNSLTNIVTIICSKVGKNIGAHSFRKFHYSTLLANGLSEQYIYMLQGKKTSTYNKAFEMGLLTEAYIKAYSSLMIFKDAENLEQLKEQRDRIDMLEEKVYKNESETVNKLLLTIEQMRAEIKELQNKN